MELSDLSVLYIMDEQNSKEEVEKILYKTVNKVFFASNIEDCKQEYKKNSPCLIVIDSAFNNREFIDFLVEIRKEDIKTAFIVLTNNLNNPYLTELMELYLTKYIIKPFTENILLGALNKCMEIIERRIYSNIRLSKDIFFNFQTQSIINNDKSYILNKKETLLINLFIQNPGRIVTYEELEYYIWNNEVTEAALKSLIRDFRKKTYKDIIKNYSGIGYKLNLE